MTKLLTALAIFVMLSLVSLMLVESATAQSIPKPSIPTFTIQLLGPQYANPTTYHLDQTSGQIVADIGYTNEYSYLEVTIKNQPLVFDYSNVHLIGAFGFYYNIQIKPHSSSQWVDIYRSSADGYLVPSNSEYTTTSISVDGYGLAGTQTDIHIEAMIGEIGRQYNPNATSPLGMYPYTFHGETSDWSKTQTISIPASVPITSSSSSNPSATLPNVAPTSPPDSVSADLTVNLALVAIVILVVTVISLLLYVKHLKRSIDKPDNSAS